ncbi:hypothetical protein NCER_101362 [Vairimorpha ceranae BRL01]|uniref:Uncharacterized protein n=2 Tax=Vairimorpha ceranae TaxID=40302 RepID=C4V9U8_VAIC1|nr:hypothetical protein AAJ76_5000027295 [Vairimorpha ceranae]EEQ81999.1 hypothetical protein NCER_101362 [Vairimorpha ceranae BRL01]KAF5140400.1 hypothetical protein G9O61_00g014160 [Vairimorpha ceranae]KKO74710.1 hypothetical protein AAJ76_5000027295 [Vairimorpha ceranae]
MKINTKDYFIPKIKSITDDTVIYEEVLDPLSDAWNNLCRLQTIEDENKDIILNINFSKVEADTLLQTYELVNKGIIKQNEVKNTKEEKVNINIIRPCIEYFAKCIDIFNSKKDPNSNLIEYYIYIKFKNIEYIEIRRLNNPIKEQEVTVENYTIKIKKGTYNKISNTIHDTINLQRLTDFILKFNINIKRNIKYINLYISKLYILKYSDKSSGLVNYGNILEDGYGEILYIVTDDIYKIKRDTYSFSVYKNERVIL